jgi:hypothetical protein
MFGCAWRGPIATPHAHNYTRIALPKASKAFILAAPSIPNTRAFGNSSGDWKSLQPMRQVRLRGLRAQPTEVGFAGLLARF